MQGTKKVIDINELQKAGLTIISVSPAGAPLLPHPVLDTQTLLSSS